MSGRLITFEGGEGAGKSTQIPILADYLKSRGQTVIQTREPGGVGNAERVRELLLDPEADNWDGITEVLLHYAARREHVEKLIRPALKRGDWVLCDRFADSTMAYQGFGSGIDPGLIRKIHRLTLGEFQPDLTIIFDLPVDIGMSRAEARGAADRYELMGKSFHEKLRKGFLNISRDEPDRCVVIDATQAIDDVANEIRAVIKTRFE